MKTLIAAVMALVGVAAALALPGVASAHDVSQEWFERHADQAAYAYAHRGDWYQSDLGTSTNPTYDRRGRRHYHAWDVRLYRMNPAKTQLCWKDAVLYWHGFEHRLGRASAHGCEDPRASYPDQWRELDINDFIGDFDL